MKSKKKEVKKEKPRKTNARIVITAIAALGFIVLSLFVWPWFIIAAIILWWMNKVYIKKHFGV